MDFVTSTPSMDRDAEVDEGSWRSVFKQTACAARPRARMEHVDDAGPGRVELPPPRARVAGIDIPMIPTASAYHATRRRSFRDRRLR